MKFFGFFFLMFITSCSSFFFTDVFAKGAKTNCLNFNVDSLKIKCNCADKKITSFIVYQNKNAKEIFGRKMLSKKFNDGLNEFVLPLPIDSIKNRFIQIEFVLSNSHPRESYYINLNPKNFKTGKVINARYFSH